MGATSAWPNQSETQLERARKVARSYRELATASAPDACAALDARAEQIGQGWVVPRGHGIELDDLVTIPELSHLLDLPVGTIRSWMSRGELPRRSLSDGTSACLMRDVVELAARKAKKRRRRVKP